MTEIKNRLFKAFGEDHAILGKALHKLAEQLRRGNIPAIKDAANNLDQKAGAHIAFEEAEFYPLLKLASPDINTDLMYQNHTIGLSVIQDILALPLTSDNATVTEAFQAKQLSNIILMDEHITECGELFSILAQLSPMDLEKLYEKLLHWRTEHPRWTRLPKFREDKNSFRIKTIQHTPSGKIP